MSVKVDGVVVDDEDQHEPCVIINILNGHYRIFYFRLFIQLTVNKGTSKNPNAYHGWIRIRFLICQPLPSRGELYRKAISRSILLVKASIVIVADEQEIKMFCINGQPILLGTSVPNLLNVLRS